MIKTHFSSTLLADYDGWAWIRNSISKWMMWAKKRYKADGRRMRDFQKHIEIFEELYEWQKAQEAYNKAENKKHAERPVVPSKAINRLCGRLGKDVRKAFILDKLSHRKH